MADDDKKGLTPEMTHEVATVLRDPFHLMLFANILPNNDKTLRQRGGGGPSAIEIYDEIRRDLHAGGVLDKRELAVIKRPWVVDSASDKPIDKDAADFVTANFKQIQLNRICREGLDATLKGYSVGEVIWDYDTELNGIVVRNVIAREQRRFVFDADRNLRLLTREALLQGVPLPDRKFIVHTVGGKDGSPYGLGLGYSLFWPVLFKRKDIGFWLTYLDKYGSPTAVGKYPANATAGQKDTLLAAIGAMANDFGVTIPEGMSIELLKALQAGSNDGYEMMVRYLDESISLRVLGEIMSSTAQSGGLGSGQANVGDDVRLEVAESDSDLWCSSINNTMVEWITNVNFPGARAPLLSRDFSEPVDLVQRSTRDKTLRDMGADFTQEYITETYGDGIIWKEGQQKPQALAFGQPMPTDPGNPEFAESMRRTSIAAARQMKLAIDDAAELLAARAPKLLQKRIDTLRALLDDSGDLVAFSEGLKAIAADAADPEFVSVMGNAGFAAQLAGRTPEQ